ncbi:LD-carboxypeptidase [Peribacillus saganii]|uniref:LD-carboxypeptidase n=1 Tax=Peribacillus saganii TaxID=2303992 RepID=A0A372LT05_9BACI|nr:LD-carboxypeptidase [Peribacillus saganii]RFU70922.1 LD-carboxypeptidase [Peribacillus saganii]
MVRKPKRLEKGDTVGIIAPASPPNHENLQRALQFFDELGLQAKLGKHLDNTKGYLAGSDEGRLSDLHEMFADKNVSAIFSACGGYGTARIASGIDYDLIRGNPKIFWGYSDITFLHTAIGKRAAMATFHGPMLASDIGKEDVLPLTKQMFSQLFQPQDIVYTEDLSPLETMIEGEAEGALTGGNLSLLVSTLGTPFELDTRDKLLLIEDVNEEPRAVDRMLNQLYMSGKLSDAAGILVADFKNCVPEREQTLTLDEVIEHYVKLAKKPALKGFNIGHCSPNIGIPLGVKATLSTSAKQVIIESGVE